VCKEIVGVQKVKAEFSSYFAIVDPEVSPIAIAWPIKSFE